MTVREYIENIAENDEADAILLTPEFDKAIIGVQRKDHIIIAVYSESKVIEVLMDTLDTDRDGALDYFGFNIEGAYMGEASPIFIEDTFMELL